MSTLGKDIVALFILLGTWYGIKMIQWFFLFTYDKVQSSNHFNGLNANEYTLIKAHHKINFIISILTFVKKIIIILLVLFAGFIVFNLFSSTEHIIHWVINFIQQLWQKIAKVFLNYLPNLFTIAIVVTLFAWLLKFLRFLKNEIQNDIIHLPKIHHSWIEPSYYILKIALIALCIIMVFPYLPGAGSPIFNGVSIFVGILFTIGSSSSFSNIIAGLALTYMNSFKDGDRIKLGDIYGDVVNKNILVTRIKTIKNEVISVPNANLLNSHIINYSKDADKVGLIIHTTVTIGYDIAWEKVHELCLKAALNTLYIESTPTPFIYQQSLDDFYVSYQLNAYTKHPNNQALIYSELHKNILMVFHEAGVEMLSPHFHALRNGTKIVIPNS